MRGATGCFSESSVEPCALPKSSDNLEKRVSSLWSSDLFPLLFTDRASSLAKIESSLWVVFFWNDYSITVTSAWSAVGESSLFGLVLDDDLDNRSSGIIQDMSSPRRWIKIVALSKSTALCLLRQHIFWVLSSVPRLGREVWGLKSNNSTYFRCVNRDS